MPRMETLSNARNSATASSAFQKALRPHSSYLIDKFIIERARPAAEHIILQFEFTAFRRTLNTEADAMRHEDVRALFQCCLQRLKEELRAEFLSYTRNFPSIVQSAHEHRMATNFLERHLTALQQDALTRLEKKMRSDAPNCTQ